MNQARYIGGAKFNYHAGYYTSNKWADNRRLVLEKWEDGAPRALCESAGFPVERCIRDF